MSTRRKATRPFELSDGTKVGVGQWICTAARGMNLDPVNYANVQDFHGFRFVNSDLFNNYRVKDSFLSDRFQIPELGKSSQFVGLSDWQLWGTGKSAW